MNSPISPLVAYYRVSTERQGQSGLGLEAQRSAVAIYAAGRDLLDEFVEVESGRKDNRPQLTAALALCRQKRAILVIAKLDRLARSVAFISNLMESGVEFVAVDMPQANRLTLHILAAVAEHEREMISQRTRAALAAAKARGTKLGNPRPDMAKLSAAAAAKASHYRSGVLPMIRILREEGRSLREIATELNSKGISSARGRVWHAASIRSMLHDPVYLNLKSTGTATASSSES
jgi:DNA invertase Pin-like site-specific DNA recombinase